MKGRQHERYERTQLTMGHDDERWDLFREGHAAGLHSSRLGASEWPGKGERCVHD
jgi:hypothetical protein